MQKWNIEYLIQLYNHYLKLSATETDISKSIEYEDTANSIFEIIDRYDQLKKKKIVSIQQLEIANFKEVISSDFDVVHRYGYYCPYIRLLDEYYEKLSVTPKKTLPQIDVSESKIVTVSCDFFAQLKGVFADTHSEISKEFKDTLHFHKLTKRNKETGQTYSVYNTGLTFIELGIDGTIQDYTSTIHEMGHGVSCFLNSQAMWDFEKYCFIEVDALFFELLGIDYVGKKLNLERDSFDINMQILYDYLYSSHLLATKLDMYSELTRKELANVFVVNEYLKEQKNFNVRGRSDVLKTYIREYMHYVVSYLTAVELYLIYQDNHEEALDLLFKIILQKESSSVEYLEFVRSLGIEPGKNFGRYIEILMNKAKELDDAKSLRYKN